jgi:hypothetical protein
MDTLDLWEAWIDLSAGEKSMLYVIGDICTGRSKTAPVLIKKKVQGAPDSHLILELLSFDASAQGRLAEVGYTEMVADSRQYRHVFICAGEDVIAHIPDIEIIY